MEKSDIVSLTIDVNASTLKSYPFKTAHELTYKYNDPLAVAVDKKYIKIIMLTILSIFKAQPAKTHFLLEALIPLALADDQDVYLTLVNLLATEVNKVEISVNNYMLKTLIQAIWINEKQPLTVKALDQLLNVAFDKIDLEVTNITLFSELFEAMSKEGVNSIDNIQRMQFEEKFTKMLHSLKDDKVWKYQDEKEELIFRIKYAYQALLRIGTNETRAEKLKRRFLAAFSELTKFASVVPSLTSMVLTGGAIVAFEIPSAIVNLVESAKDINETFNTKNKAQWYSDLQTLQAALLKKAWEKNKYSFKEVNAVNQEFGQLTQAQLSHHVKYGIIDTLQQIIQYHPDEKIKEISLDVLKEYANDAHLISKVVHTYAELAVRVPAFETDITTAINDLGLQADYNKVKLQVTEKSTVSTPLTFNLIEEGQKTVNKMLQANSAKTIETVIKAMIFEDVANTGGQFNSGDVAALRIKAVEGASQEEHERLKDIIQQIQSSASKINSVVTEKGPVLENVTVGITNMTGIKFNSHENKNVKKEIDKRHSHENLHDSVYNLQFHQPTASVENTTNDFINKKFKQFLVNELKPYLIEHYNNLSPKVFIFYSWEKKYASLILKLAKDLQSLGCIINFDLLNNKPGGLLADYLTQISEADVILIIGTPALLDKYEKRSQLINNNNQNIWMEGQILNYFAIHNQSWNKKITPVIIEDYSVEQSLPIILRRYIPLNLQSISYCEGFIELAASIYSINRRDQNFKKLIRQFFKNNPQALKERENNKLQINEAATSNLENIKDSILTKDLAKVESIYKNKSIEQGYLNRLWNVPVLTPYFIERPELLKIIEYHFEKKSFPENYSLPLVACCGLAGVGKTQLVLSYVYRFSEKYRAVFWINAESEVSLKSSYFDLADNLGLSTKNISFESLLEKIKQWINSNQEVLLIYDNAKNYEAIEKFLPRKGCYVLVTSRYMLWPTVIRVNEFNLLEAKTYIQNVLGYENDDESIKELSQILGYLPLALSQATFYIKQTGISIENYISLYQLQKKLLLSRQVDSLGYEKISIASVLKITLDEIINKSPLVEKILFLCAFLQHQSIPVSLLIKIMESISNQNHEIYIYEAIGLLKNYFLINQDQVHLSMNSFIQEIIQLNFEPKKFIDYFSQVSLELVKIYSQKDLGDKIEQKQLIFRQLLAFLLNCLNYIKNKDSETVLNHIKHEPVNLLKLISIVNKDFYLITPIKYRYEIYERISNILTFFSKKGIRVELAKTKLNLGKILLDFKAANKARDNFDQALLLIDENNSSSYEKLNTAYQICLVHPDYGPKHVKTLDILNKLSMSDKAIEAYQFLKSTRLFYQLQRTPQNNTINISDSLIIDKLIEATDTNKNLSSVEKQNIKEYSKNKTTLKSNYSKIDFLKKIGLLKDQSNLAFDNLSQNDIGLIEHKNLFKI